jgi:hypothetical protein
MKWQRLSEMENLDLSRSTLFRFAAKWPYEQTLELMLCEGSLPEQINYLNVNSGFKAGLVFLILPSESKADGGVGISLDWIRNNWKNWIYDCSPKNVFVCIKGRPKPRLPTNL